MTIKGREDPQWNETGRADYASLIIPIHMETGHTVLEGQKMVILTVSDGQGQAATIAMPPELIDKFTEVISEGLIRALAHAQMVDWALVPVQEG